LAQLPDFLKQGEKARLFPTVADTNRENRLTSIFLALLPQMPVVAESLLSTVGLRVGKRTRIETWTEVVPIHGEHLDKRPDGLIVVHTGKNTWKALVETKIKGAQLNEDQISRYLEVARAAGIDAVLTISNQFSARADHPPVHVQKALLKKVGLFHWSWVFVQTQCEILSYQQAVEDTEQSFLLEEFLRLLAHRDTGVERFTSMGKPWKEIVTAVSNQAKLKKSSPEVEEVVGHWQQEERDLCLQLSRHIGARVETVLERKHQSDPALRLKDAATQLAEKQTLTASYKVPDAAAPLEVCADLMRRTLTYGMKIKAPADRKSTKARVNWLLRMIPEDDPRLLLRAHWPGRAAPTQERVAALREDPTMLQTDNVQATPHAFELLLVDDLGGDFSGTRKFIEKLEAGIGEFYDLAGQHLRVWQAPPPKPVSTRTSEATADGCIDEGASVAATETQAGSPANPTG